MASLEINELAVKPVAIERYANSKLPTEAGPFKCIVYRDQNGAEHLALVKGDLGQENILCRVHSECLTGEVFGSLRCDCRKQLSLGLHAIQQRGSGVLIYLRQEGRGIGLGNKIRAYELQDQGLNTVEANRELGFGDDLRSYAVAAHMLADLGVQSVSLMTNNPKKIKGLVQHGIDVIRRIPHTVAACETNRRYLETKKNQMGHLN